MKHVNMMSGGVGSWACGKRVADRHGTDALYHLFADTRFEDADLYRFLPEAVTNIGGTLVWTAEGRDIWQVMIDVKFLGNTRADPCSRVLKRQWLRRWLEANCDPADTTVYIGYDANERGRMADCLRYWAPWRVEFPLADFPSLSKRDCFAWLEREGIAPPSLYEDGFPHNNCRGGCIKAGQGQFVRLYETRPEAFAAWEAGEKRVRESLGRDVAILRDRRGGDTKPLPLRVLRERIESGCQVERGGRVGCGCFVGDDSVSLFA